MDLARFVLLNVALLSAMLVVGSLRAHPRRWDWLVLELAFAAAAGLGWWRWPALAPWVAGLFLVLVWVPLLGLAAALRLEARRPRLARALLHVAYALHPAGHVALHRRLLRARDRRARGEPDDDAALDAHPLTAHLVALERARAEHDWAEVVARCDRPHPALSPQEQLGAVFPLYLRALGELGQQARMLEVTRAGLAYWAHDAGARATCALFISAFAGRGAAVDALAAGPLAGALTPSLVRFWRATAAAARGEPVDDWQALTDDDDPRVASAARYRLRHGVPRATAPAAEVDAVLAHMAMVAAEADAPIAPAPRAWATLALMAVLVVAHLVVIGGDQAAWFERGMFSSWHVRAGAWWRLVSSGLLHAGWLHLALNVVGLWVFGRALERALGPARLVALVVLGVLGGSLFTTGLVLAGLMPETFAIGASGGVMALLGATLAVALVRWRRGDNPGARDHVGSALMLVGVQVLFDLGTPQVSMAGHIGGLVTGLLLGLLFAPRPNAPRSPGRVPHERRG